MARRRSSGKGKGDYPGAATLGGVALAGLAVFILLSLVSYDVDGGARDRQDGHNLCGIVGDRAAWLLFQCWGLSSFAFAAVLGGWGAVLAGRGVPGYPGLRIAGSIFFIASLAAIDSLVRFSALGLPGGPDLGIREGGRIGSFFAEALRPSLGSAGTLLIFTMSLALSAVLAADKLLFRGVVLAAKGAFIAARWSCRMCGAALARWRRSREARREELLRRAGAEEEEEFEEEGDEEDDAEEDEAGAERKVKVRKTPRVKVSSVPDLAPQQDARWTPSRAADGDLGKYELPRLDMLEDPEPANLGDIEQQIARNIEMLEKTLAEFDVEARVVETNRGPVITLYALDLAPGTKVQRIMALSNDLSRALKSTGLRIQAPIPKTTYVGIEIPNATKEQVRLKEILASPRFNASKYTIPIVLGKDASGKPIVQDLANMPHMLIAGTTGSGKSVCLNSIILSILYTRYPSDVKLLLVDPKMVELSSFRDIPHLLHPVITDMKKAPQVLEWAVDKMDERYEHLARTGARNITQFNRLGTARIDAVLAATDGEPGDIPYHMPYIVIVIDELADLMMTSRKEVEAHITRLAQKSRAIGIHIILATQRPSIDVITGLIKSNISARVAFRVFSKIDSRVIMDTNGAETLLGQGDMLFLVPGTSTLVRAQGAYVSDQEIKTVTEFIKGQASPQYSRELESWGSAGVADDEKDELFDRAAEIVVDNQRGSVSLLQRQLAVGYTRASRLMEQLAMAGIVGEFKGSKARPVLVKQDEYRRMMEEEEEEEEEDD